MWWWNESEIVFLKWLEKGELLAGGIRMPWFALLKTPNINKNTANMKLTETLKELLKFIFFA